VLIDFSETRLNQSLFRDFSKFETHLTLELLPEPPSLSALRRFVEWQVDMQNLVPVDWRDYVGGCVEGWPPRKALELLVLIRECLNNIINQYIQPVYLKPEGAHTELRRCYYFSLWREYMRAWSWMLHVSPIRKVQNLVTISRIVELCCRPTRDRTH
jgi:hypothetical protein